MPFNTQQKQYSREEKTHHCTLKNRHPVLENHFTPTGREGISKIKRRSDRSLCQQGLITHRLSLADWRLSADYCNSEERLMCHFVGRVHPFKINCVTQLYHGPKRKKKGGNTEKKKCPNKKCSLALESQICFKVSKMLQNLLHQCVARFPLPLLPFATFAPSLQIDRYK